MPKRMDDYLYSNSHYDLYVKPKESPFFSLSDLAKGIIEEIIDSYKVNISVSSQNTRIAIESALNKAEKFIQTVKQEKELTAIDKVIIYMAYANKPLSKTGAHYKKLVSLLNENGIRKADYETLTPELLQARFLQKNSAAPGLK